MLKIFKKYLQVVARIKSLLTKLKYFLHWFIKPSKGIVIHYSPETKYNTVDIYIATLWRQGHIVKTLSSLRNQLEFGTATITCNNWSDDQWEWINRLFGDDNKVRLYRGDNAKGSNEKLRYVGTGDNEYIMFADDDIIYPPNYLEFMIYGCEKYDAYVSCHGVRLNPLPITSYYHDRVVYRGLRTVLFDMEVDIASNCGSLFKRRFFNPDELNEWYDRVGNISMDDIYTNYFAKCAGVKRYVLSHCKGFLRHKQQMPDDDYVFNRYTLTGKDLVQTTFINTFWTPSRAKVLSYRQ